ncbi:MAG: hypothetical protein WKG01_23225 [Kofleriaceae bacterium]
MPLQGPSPFARPPQGAPPQSSPNAPHQPVPAAAPQPSPFARPHQPPPGFAPPSPFAPLPHDAPHQPPPGTPHRAPFAAPHAPPPNPYAPPNPSGAAPYPYPAGPVEGAAPYPYPAQPHPLPIAHAILPGGVLTYSDTQVSLGRAVLRAVRMRIEPDEITHNERMALLEGGVTDPNLMAFLGWRRSVLVLVAIALVPLTILRFIDAAKDTLPGGLKMLIIVPAIAEAFLCAVCWMQLRNWTKWPQQRRTLFRAWLVFMAAPFLVFLIPMDGIIDDIIRDRMGGAQFGELAGDPRIAQMAMGLKAMLSIYALMTLAPKAVSLLAGTIRAGIVTKMLFPGTAGPGWIVVFSTPIYTLMVFTLLIVPYQITGSGWYISAMIALAIAQVSLGRAGYALTRPTTHDDAVAVVSKARATYLIATGLFALFLMIALGSLAKQLGVLSILTFVLSFEVNVLLLTLIGSDLVITNLERARGHAQGIAHLADDSNRKLASFVNSAPP